MRVMGSKIFSVSMLFAVLASGQAAAQDGGQKVQLDAIQVEESLMDDSDAQRQTIKTDPESRRATGNTLGDYLDDQPNVESASYGPGVGRPVIRGMDGYRVKILQNDTEVSDLSAMSSDHAVGVMPKASERIELLKGPASVLYGANAGGIVRLVDDEESFSPKKGLHGKLQGSAADNNDARNLGAVLSAAGEAFSVHLSGFKSQTEDYTDGDGNKIWNSDVLTEQGKVVAGYQYRPTGRVAVSYQYLHKDYGIPNRTTEATRIDMTSKTYGLKIEELDLSKHIDRLQFDLNYTDYLHDETEGDERDGLFGQKTTEANLTMDYGVGKWLGTVIVGYRQNDLQVCHEHGGCEKFTKADRTGGPLGTSVLNYYNATGLPYSHGNPMPDTDTQTGHVGILAERPVGDSDAVLSLGAHLEVRNLEANPDNIQQTWVYPPSLDPDYYNTDTDWAASLSAGWEQPLSKGLKTSLNLSYLERLPSADELYWNGFHHATDSYIFGNRDLNKEKSLNLDWDTDWQNDTGRLQVSAFFYRFWDYIYQQTLYDDQGQVVTDPFHLSPVWETQQTDAIFYGGSVAYDWNVVRLNSVPLVLQNQFDALRAEKVSGGNLPRTAPMSWLIGLNYAPDQWTASLSLKHVFEATEVAEHEAETPGYNWLKLYLDWKPKTQYGNWVLWMKGDNLLDEYAQNHISFLKDYAPLIGRQFSVGVQLDF